MADKRNESKFCINCGILIEKRYGKRRRSYCSEECQNEHARKRRQDASADNCCEYTCAYCGNTFIWLVSAERKYCSAACYGMSARKSEAAVLPSGDLKLLRCEAARLRESGISVKEISARLSVSYHTVSSWFRNTPRSEAVSALHCESIRLLETPSPGRVFLVCAPVNFHGKYDKFAGQIPHELEPYIREGGLFVFCSRNRYQIAVLQWQGDGFAAMFKRTEQARYPWPAHGETYAIEVSRSDLNILLEYPGFMRRLSGYRSHAAGITVLPELSVENS